MNGLFSTLIQSCFRDVSESHAITRPYTDSGSEGKLSSGKVIFCQSIIFGKHVFAGLRDRPIRPAYAFFLSHICSHQGIIQADACFIIVGNLIVQCQCKPALEEGSGVFNIILGNLLRIAIVIGIAIVADFLAIIAFKAQVWRMIGCHSHFESTEFKRTISTKTKV